MIIVGMITEIVELLERLVLSLLMVRLILLLLLWHGLLMDLLQPFQLLCMLMLLLMWRNLTCCWCMQWVSLYWINHSWCTPSTVFVFVTTPRCCLGFREVGSENRKWRECTLDQTQPRGAIPYNALIELRLDWRKMMVPVKNLEFLGLGLAAGRRWREKMPTEKIASKIATQQIMMMLMSENRGRPRPLND